jgi:hypothetical protein
MIVSGRAAGAPELENDSWTAELGSPVAPPVAAEAVDVVDPVAIQEPVDLPGAWLVPPSPQLSRSVHPGTVARALARVAGRAWDPEATPKDVQRMLDVVRAHHALRLDVAVGLARILVG